MGGLRESWCFCNGGGGGKSERMKAALLSGRGPAMASITAGNSGGTGFLIHCNLLLTTHANLPTVAAADAAEIRLQNGVAVTLFPHRFFITSAVLDPTIVGLDAVDENPQLQQPHYLKACPKPNLELGNVVYLLGYAEETELVVGEGKVTIATDNLIKLSTDGVSWNPGSAGFDVHGNLAFMVCDPMKLATSPYTKFSSSSSSSKSSSKKDHPSQFGIPIPIICDWLNQHWEGNFDELNKLKLPIIRLSTGHKIDHSCPSFTMRQVFKSTEAEIEETMTSMASRAQEQSGLNSSAITNTLKDRRVTAQIQLLDINFPPRITKSTISQQPVKRVPPRSEEEQSSERGQFVPMEDAESTGSVNGAQSEVQSSSSPIDVRRMQHEYSSEGETTMYSAETAESRNYPSPREGRFQYVGRSQSCINYNRWGTVPKNGAAPRAVSEKQRSKMQGRKVCSTQVATYQRSNEYFSPTVASVMKKRNSGQQPTRAQQKEVHTPPRWVF